MQNDDCTSCPIANNRRDFLRTALLAVAQVAGAAVVAQIAHAMPMGYVSAIARAGQKHTYAIPAGDGVQIDRDAELILVRWENTLYAFNLSCPHQNTALRWNDGNHRFQCPKHHSQYQPSGEFIDGRATRGMDRLGIRREGETVVIDVDTMFKQTDDPAAWSAAAVKLA